MPPPLGSPFARATILGVSLFVAMPTAFMIAPRATKAADPPKNAPVEKPDPKKIVSPKSAPPKTEPKSPFAGFPAAVELPSLPTADSTPNDFPKPVVLGPVALAPQMICLVQLLGAAEVIKKTQELSLEAMGDPTAARDWTFVLRDRGRSDAGTPLARLVVQNHQLLFAWTPQAATQPAAGQLCNCILKMAAGSGTHTLALRRPGKIPARVLTFEDDMVSRWELKNAPPSSQLNVEMRLAGNDVPRYRFVGSSTLRPGESTWLEFIKTKSDQVLKFRIACQLNRGLEVTVAPFFQTVIDSKPMRLTDATRKKAETQVRALRQQLEQQSKMQEAAIAKKGAKKGKGNSSSPTSQPLEIARMAVSQFDHLDTLQKGLEGKVRLEFRVYRIVDGEPVDILVSSTKPVGKKK